MWAGSPKARISTPSELGEEKTTIPDLQPPGCGGRARNFFLAGLRLARVVHSPRWVAAAATVVALQVALASVLGPSEGLTAYTLITVFLLTLVAASVATLNAIKEGRASRPFWMLFALAMALWALDHWLWVYHAVWHHEGVPNESIGESALFLHTVPLMAALATRPHLQPSTRRLHQTTFSFLLLLFFWVFLYAYYVFPYQFLFPDPLTYWFRYNSLYLCENLALLLFAGVLILRSEAPWRWVYTHLFGAAGLYALTSVLANVAINTTETYYVGGISDWGFTAVACWFILAALPGRNLPAMVDRRRPFSRRLARYTSLLAIMGVVMVPLMGIWALNHPESLPHLQKVHLLIILTFAMVFTALVFLQMYVVNRDLHLEIGVRLEAEKGLREAKMAAEAGNHAKAEFLANMSHEIRTPMNGILGMTDLVLETHLTEEQRECLQMARSSADSLLTIINDILDFSKVDAGRLEMELVEFNLHDVVAQSTQLFSPKAASKGLELISDIQPEVPAVLFGDPTRLRQVIVNLVGNALKFTETGTIIMRVALAASSLGEVLLHFSVQDTGVGIPKEKQKVIFAPFAQADGSTNRKFGGTGLGLSISSRLVQLMGGTIWVESEPGMGSTFHFTSRFAVVREAAGVQPDPAQLPPPTPPSPPRPECPGLRILLAEDNLVNQRLALRLLEKHGHCVCVVGNGREALAALTDDSFDLVLMDVQMPEMDGLEATAAIRAEEKRTGGHLPIIAMTAHSMKGDRENCLAAGMDGYISKPINLKELLAVIEQVAAGREAPPPHHSPGDFQARYDLV